ncbi:MAG: indolepyruvate ferredoxin oxidoreductase subunit alpha [Deltaproteobacteria bacterium HGW-Deltaproteobacteria-21]|nr:MAG: indolepyruvate ferredoxin oxidoreductase subunit alpha [Deltaproteobacteria bacterium HGW-Deltaproteobacteria-21]
MSRSSPWQEGPDRIETEPGFKPKGVIQVTEKKYVMGNLAIARAADEAGVKLVAGYPGTPATEIVEEFLDCHQVHAEWACNEKVALEMALGASLANVRAMAVMKHNGTNVCTDILMHLNFTGVKAGLLLVSADDPGGLSSQNEEDSRILVHSYANLPVFDPSNAAEAKTMVKDAFDLSEKTRMCFVLRPVLRVCHSRSVIDFKAGRKARSREARWEDDRERYIMSAVEVRELGGIKRPQARHRWLNAKYRELAELFEKSPYNQIEPGNGGIGLIGCGIGYTYIKEASLHFSKSFPVLKLGTLPIPRKMVLEFLKGKRKVVVFEEVEPVVEGLIKQLCQEERVPVKVLGRSGFYASDGELTTQIVIEAVKKADPQVKLVDEVSPRKLDIEVPVRTRTQCVGCAHRPLLYNIKKVARKKKCIVFGDIGCHDAGSFKPMELQSTIYCMGSSIPMATGAYFAGEKRPVISMIGDSTFFHLGLNGLINAAYQGSKQVIVLGDNRTTAMTGFQPHAGSGVNLRGEPAPVVDLEKFGEAIGVSVHSVDPYDVKGTYKVLEQAVMEKGVSLVIASRPCFLQSSRKEPGLFKRVEVKVEESRCNGCMTCINDFGCPALVYDGEEKKVHIEPLSCVKCGMCAEVCRRGAIS